MSRLDDIKKQLRESGLIHENLIDEYAKRMDYIEKRNNLQERQIELYRKLRNKSS